MITRNATAQWKGSIGAGKGTMTAAGYTLDYSVPSRFENGEGTNPEELIAGAHAGCFAMALSAALTRAHHEVVQLDATAAVTVDKDDSGWFFKRIELTVRGNVPGISEEEFVKIAQEAKAGCPVSRALAAVEEITLDAKLVG